MHARKRELYLDVCFNIIFDYFIGDYYWKKLVLGFHSNFRREFRAAGITILTYIYRKDFKWFEIFCADIFTARIVTLFHLHYLFIDIIVSRNFYNISLAWWILIFNDHAELWNYGRSLKFCNNNERQKCINHDDANMIIYADW